MLVRKPGESIRIGTAVQRIDGRPFAWRSTHHDGRKRFFAQCAHAHRVGKDSPGGLLRWNLENRRYHAGKRDELVATRLMDVADGGRVLEGRS